MKKLLLSLLLLPIFSFGQFMESFEAATTVPAGWTVIDGGDANNTWAGADLATSTGLQAQNGTKIFSIGFGATAHNDFLITPQITVTAGVSDKLSFWVRSRDVAYPEVISVKISNTTPTEAGMTITLIPTVAPASGGNFVKFSADLTPYIGSNIYIGFHSTTTDLFRFDIDNVVVGGTTTCNEPLTTITTSNVGATTATITWTAPTPAPANGYDIYYSTSGVAPTNSTSPNLSVAAGVTTANLTGLTQLTKYYLYIRSKCSLTSNSVWGPLSVFNSFVDPVALPYSSGFDNDSQLAGWTISGNNTDSMGLGTNASLAHNAVGQYWIFNTTAAPAAANNNWFYCRPFSLTAGEVVTTSFWYRTAVANRSLRLTVGNLNNATNQTNVVYTNTNLPIATNYAQITTPTFTAPTTGVYYFAFNDTSAPATSATLRLDTVSFTSVLSNEKFNSESISIYPNPATDVLNVSGVEGVTSLVINDINGRTIKTVNDASSINVSDLNAGVYFINITTDNGNVTKKFMKN